MEWTESKTHGTIAGVFLLGVLFQFLGCWLWNNWWPLLTAFAYVLVPMPYLFFGGGSHGAGLRGGWVDAGKFLTGSSCVATVAVPAILHHAGKITVGALWMEILAVFLMASSLIAYDVVSEGTSSGGLYSAF